MNNHIKEILFSLADGGVHFIIGGGVAAVMHGVERVTMDIDIAVDLESENLSRLVEVARKLGLRPRVPVPIEALGDPQAIKMMVEEKHALVFTLIDPSNPLRYVDIFLKKELSFHALAKDSVTMNVDGRILKLASAQKLVDVKKAIHPPREKDRLDILMLEQIIHDSKKNR